MTFLLASGLFLWALPSCSDSTSTGADTGLTLQDTDSTDTGDSGTATDTVDTVSPCTVAVSDTEPQESEEDVFWRAPLQVWFDGSFQDLEKPVFGLVSETAGESVPLTETWDAGEDSVVLEPAAPLTPDTAYALSIEACGQTWSVPFSTSVYGTPVTEGASSLLDRTWVLETGKVRWTQPEGAAELLGTFFTEPLLVGVQEVRGDIIDLLVGIGGFTDLEGFQQLVGQGTWDLLDVDLSQGAWFQGVADQIVFSYGGVDIPVHDFGLQGTFAPDGSVIEGASVAGLVDTRNISLLFNLDQPDFICTTYARDYGLECTLCPDDELLCLDLAGEDVTLEEQPGLTLERNDLSEDGDN